MASRVQQFVRPRMPEAAPLVAAPQADDELNLVLTELVQQAGACLGIILVDRLDCRSARVIAEHGTARLSPQRIDDIVAAVRRSKKPATRGHDDASSAPRWVESPPSYDGKLLAMPIIIDADRQVIAAVGFDLNTEQAVRDEAVAAARRILPVFSSYVRLWNRFQDQRRLTSGLSDALDQSEVGVVVLDAGAGVQFVNRAAGVLLDAEEGLRYSTGSVVATSLTDAIRLQVTIEHVIARNRAETRGARPTAHVLLLHRGARKRPLVASLVEAEKPATATDDPAAILYLVKPEHDLRPFVTSLCQLHGLSPAETRLACHLVMGKTLAEAALALRIKEHTARAYLKQIFLKTDTNRQTDLVRLMLSSLVPMTEGSATETVV